MNKHCVHCKKIMTNNEQLSSLNNFHYTYVEDVVDDNLRIPGIGQCDECGAKRDYEMIVNCIRNDVNRFGKDYLNSLKDSRAFLEKRLRESKEKWLNYVTEGVNLNRNTYWHEILKGKIDNLKLDEALKKEEKKKKLSDKVQENVV